MLFRRCFHKFQVDQRDQRSISIIIDILSRKTIDCEIMYILLKRSKSDKVVEAVVGGRVISLVLLLLFITIIT